MAEIQKMTSYNGHRSWNAWNVSLWISNEEGIYRFAIDCIEKAKKARDGKLTKQGQLNLATRLFMNDFRDSKTPDGAKYNPTSVKEALSGLDE